MALDSKWLEAAAGWSLRYLLSRFISTMPTVEFGCPRQESGWGPSEPRNIAWWHIPISIRFKFWWQKAPIERCRVFLHPNNRGAGIYLRWQSRDSQEGVSEINLDEGRTYLVPVAFRDETGDGSAAITNDNFLLSRTAKWRVPAGSTLRLRIEIQSGARTQRCRHDYFLKVPPAGVSNGQFSLEMRHPGRD